VETPLFPAYTVLIVDDEENAVRMMTNALRLGGLMQVIPCGDSREVMNILSEKEVGVVLLDLTMPNLPGDLLLPSIVEQFPDMPVIVVTGVNEVDMAVKCMRLGAFDYLAKPFEAQRFVSSVKRALELRELRAEYASLKEGLFSHELRHPEAFSAILTNSPKMFSVFRFAESICNTGKPILVIGETGVGKELMARAIHSMSGRSGVFVAVNVAGVDDSVFSDTLFGHVRGAFTGAESVRPGLFEQAFDGTIFLDEIGDLAMASQVKLLRLLQEREYFPLGSDVPKHAEARIVLATNRNLEKMVEEGRFRSDLYYRLQVHLMRIPPLRDRLEDIPLLLDHFLDEASRVLSKTKPTIPREVTNLLATYSFPGNIRELESMVYAAVGRHEAGRLSVDAFRNAVEKERNAKLDADIPLDGRPPILLRTDVFPTLKETTEFLVREAMRRSGGNQTLAAELLGITPSGINKRLKRAEGKIKASLEPELDI
jgi:DNA-binding NtrC family response regulator